MQTQPVTGIRNYTDRELYTGAGQRCERWLICYPDEIHQVVASPDSGTVYSLQIIPQEKLYEKSLSELKVLLDQFELAKNEFTQVHAVIADSRYTFVPEPLFEAIEAKTYYLLIHALPRLHSVHYEKTKDKVCVYAVNDLFHNALRIALPGVTFHHYALMLSNAFQSLTDRKHEHRLYVHLFENGMDVFRYQSGGLTYHNHFPFESETDVVYFILSLAETIDSANDELEVMLCGALTQDGSLVNLMKKYIPKVTVLKRATRLKFPPVFRSLQEQQYYIDFTGL